MKDIINNLQEIIKQIDKDKIELLIQLCETTDNIDLVKDIKEKGLPLEIFISKDLRDLVEIFNYFAKVRINPWLSKTKVWFSWVKPFNETFPDFTPDELDLKLKPNFGFQLKYGFGVSFVKDR